MSLKIFWANIDYKFSVQIIVANFKFMCIHTHLLWKWKYVPVSEFPKVELAEASPGELLNTQITGPHIHGFWFYGGGWGGEGGRICISNHLPVTRVLLMHRAQSEYHCHRRHMYLYAAPLSMRLKARLFWKKVARYSGTNTGVVWTWTVCWLILCVNLTGQWSAQISSKTWF